MRWTQASSALTAISNSVWTALRINKIVLPIAEDACCILATKWLCRCDRLPVSLVDAAEKNMNDSCYPAWCHSSHSLQYQINIHFTTASLANNALCMDFWADWCVLGSQCCIPGHMLHESTLREPVFDNSTTHFLKTRSIWKILGPFATASRLMPIHQMSVAVLSCAACASMSTTSTTTTTTRQWQRKTEGTAMAPWNGPNNFNNSITVWKP